MITKSISIICEGAIGGVLGFQNIGILVNAGAGDIVFLRGLDIKGVSIGAVGVTFNSGAALHQSEVDLPSTKSRKLPQRR